jgi:hypothetical protein
VPAHPALIDVQARVFMALCKLGFRERAVRRVLDELRARADADVPTAEQLLRTAIARLTASS